MSPRRHSADLRGRRHDLGIGVRDMAAGLGIGTGHLLSMEDGTATEEDKTFYRTWLSHEGWSTGERHFQLKGSGAGRRFGCPIGQCYAGTAIGGQGKTSDG